MTEHADKENKKEQSSERKDESWKPDKELEVQAWDELVRDAYYGGPPISREELRELLQELMMLLKDYMPEKLFGKKDDLRRINMMVNELIHEQQGNVEMLQWRMSKKALKHLEELNSNIGQFLKRMTSFEHFSKEKLEVKDILDMVKRTSKEANEA
jgi:hypothetical protein